MTLLEISSMNASYGKIQVLFDVSLEIPEGGFVTLLGKNGVGKTTTIKSILNLTTIDAGTIHFGGTDITGRSPEETSRMGIAIVPERRRLYSGMTVMENLRLGHFPHETEGSEDELITDVFERFPRLKKRQTQDVDTMSGGEQQMMAFGRAMMSEPDLFLVDEPTEGLMPTYVETISEVLQDLHDQGRGVLLVEQNIDLALDLSEYCYVMEKGRVTYEGESEDLATDEELRNRHITI